MYVGWGSFPKKTCPKFIARPICLYSAPAMLPTSVLLKDSVWFFSKHNRAALRLLAHGAAEFQKRFVMAKVDGSSNRTTFRSSPTSFVNWCIRQNRFVLPELGLGNACSVRTRGNVMGNVSFQSCKVPVFSMDKYEVNLGSGNRIPSLDGLRAVSICMVVIGHCSKTITGLSSSAYMFLGFVGAGRLGVSTFFVISGFLITTLLVREQLSTHTISLKDFYIRRAFRIFPGFYAYWLVAFVLALLGYIQLSRSDLISAATYIWNYVPRNVDTWFLGHTWSLSVEEQFYLLWPLILKLSGPKRGTWAALAVVVTAPFVRLGSYFLLPSTRPRIGMMLHTRADSLMIGALLALMCFNEDHLRILKRLARSWLIPIVSLCFLVVDTLLTMRFKGVYFLYRIFTAKPDDRLADGARGFLCQNHIRADPQLSRGRSRWADLL